HWEDFRQTHPTPESQADFVWDQYVKGPANHAADQPFFVYLHEYDPHTPYEPLPPFDAMYDTGLGESFNVELHSYASFWLINSHAMGLTRGEVAQFKAMYRGEISFMDRYVGRIMERLRESDLEKKTLVVFLSDHGEEFMEHGRMGHTDSVFDELLRIPLIFSLPGVLPEGRRPETPVEIIDVPTTIYDLLGIESPSPVQGVSLLSALDAPDDFALARPTFGQWVRQPGPGNPAPAVSYDSVRLGNWKLVRNVLDHDRPDEMQYELYDTANDPDEIVNLWANRPVIGRTLAVMIERQLEIDRAYRRSKSTPAENQAVDPEVLERLRSLGYGGQ
ncbi:MAG: sulfatase-like hydrolase/transferase, partial [Myxococcota bacterium]